MSPARRCRAKFVSQVYPSILQALWTCPSHFDSIDRRRHSPAAHARRVCSTLYPVIWLLKKVFSSCIADARLWYPGMPRCCRSFASKSLRCEALAKFGRIQPFACQSRISSSLACSSPPPLLHLPLPELQLRFRPLPLRLLLSKLPPPSPAFSARFKMLLQRCSKP